MRTQIRYYQQDENGETRAERAERFNQPSAPPVIVPDAGADLWAWYWNASNGLQRVRDGVAFPIPPSEWESWARITGRIVWPSEYVILRAMDKAFCEETNKELKAYFERKFPPKEKG